MTFGDPDGFLCVYVGRISNEKRLDVIRAAVQKLTGDKATYIAIVGDIALFLSSYLCNTHLVNRVIFLSIFLSLSFGRRWAQCSSLGKVARQGEQNLLQAALPEPPRAGGDLRLQRPARVSL